MPPASVDKAARHLAECMAGEDFPSHNCHATCDDLANLLLHISNLTHQLEITRGQSVPGDPATIEARTASATLDALTVPWQDGDRPMALAERVAWLGAERVALAECLAEIANDYYHDNHAIKARALLDDLRVSHDLKKV